jgi:hypothetical protein
MVGQPALVLRSMAGLPGRRAWVKGPGPPLKARGPSRGFVLIWSPNAGSSKQVLPLSRLLPWVLKTPVAPDWQLMDVLLARSVLRSSTVPEARLIPPPPLLVLVATVLLTIVKMSLPVGLCCIPAPGMAELLLMVTLVNVAVSRLNSPPPVVAELLRSSTWLSVSDPEL